MSIDLPLESMPAAENLQSLEAIWASLCQTPADIQSPEWHKEILAERTRRLESGRATSFPWSDAKARLLKLGQ